MWHLNQILQRVNLQLVTAVLCVRPDSEIHSETTVYEAAFIARLLPIYVAEEMDSLNQHYPINK